MKLNSSFVKRLAGGVALLVLAGLLNLATARAEQPLSKDDVTLLLMGSSPSTKVIQLVEQRGVDFQMNPDLAKRFHDQGASDDLIEALQKAGYKAAAAKASSPAPAASTSTGGSASPTAPATATGSAPSPSPEASPTGKPNAPGAPEPPAAEAPRPASTSTAPPASSSEPVLHTRESSASSTTPAAAPSPQPQSPRVASSNEPVLHQPAKQETPASAPTSNSPGLKDPSPEEVQHIIQEFATKEKIFREARNNYTYHQINKVQELGNENEVVGTYEQEWDILYDDSGKRVEKVTYAPVNTLKGLIVTKEDIEGFRNIQPFVLTSDELPEYEIKYLGHVKVDEITAFVFSIRPKEIQKNRQYFQGIVWVDDRDLQIVKTEGKQVPQAKVSHGQENLFPRFTTWREQIDGKFWFPTYTMADDTLYFSQGPSVHMKEIVRYTDYKQFKSGSRIISVEAVDKSKDQTTPAATPPKK